MEDKLDKILELTLLSAKKVLNLADVCLLTGLSKSHLYKLTSSHQIPYYKPNNKLMYFDKGEIEDWMKQNRIATEDEIEECANIMLTNRKGGYK